MELTVEGLSAAGHDNQHLYQPSPKRKREATSLAAADTSFAPKIPPSTTISFQHNQLSSSSPPSSPLLRPTLDNPAYPPLHIPLLDHEHDTKYTGADSPRSAVARKLEGLDLAVRTAHGRPMPILSFGEAGNERKKPKLDPDLLANELIQEQDFDPLSLRAGSPVKSHFAMDSGKQALARSKSPPLSSGPPKGIPFGDSSIIWWSDAEITGHLGLDPEDDGYGINGIGFKPTPAMAAARSMKRRRQVDEWRTRELREERRRRADARRRAGSADPGGGPSRGGIVKRTVRFAS